MTDETEYEETEFGLVLAFDSDDPEFNRGFEAGMLWMSLGDKKVTKINQHIQAKNAEMVIRMCDKQGWTYKADDLGNEWLYIFLQRIDDGR